MAKPVNMPPRYRLIIVSSAVRMIEGDLRGMQAYLFDYRRVEASLPLKSYPEEAGREQNTKNTSAGVWTVWGASLT